MPSISGLAVVATEYPSGQAGVDTTIAKMVSFIHEGRSNALARQFAEGIVRQAGMAVNSMPTHRQIMQAFLDYVRENIRYRPDAHMTETVQNPTVTLCVPGAAACIPVEDCDGGATVLGWLATAYGIPVRLLIQHFNTNTDHVLLEFQDDDGSWLAADFSNYNFENNPVGWAPECESDYRVDPFDSDNLAMAGAREVEFVAVGRVPRRLAGLPRVSIGRLPPRAIAVAASTPLFVAPFEQASTDLQNQVIAVVAAGDTYANASPANPTQALSSYKAAGQAGATSVGPEIDLAGASWVTQPLTHQAWVSNGDLQAITATDATSLATAKTYITNMVALWQQAINDGTTAALQGSTPPRAQGAGHTLAVVLGIGLLGGVGYAFAASRAPRRRR